MKKRYLYILIASMILGLLTGCHKKADDKKEGLTRVITFYYLNSEDNGLVKKKKQVEFPENPEGAAKVVLDQLAQEDSSEEAEYHAILNDEISYEKIYQKEEKQICIDFKEGYLQMEPGQEILVRSAVVKTLVQLPYIKAITFTVNDEPLTNKDGLAIGIMQDANFVMDNDKKEVYDATENVFLFLASTKGGELKRKENKLEIHDNISMERAVLEALMETYEEKEKVKSPLPAELKFNRVNVAQNTCYVDLSEEIQEVVPGVDDNVKIYSMVNTLTSLPRIQQVQFTVEGKPLSDYLGISDYDGPLTMSYMEE